MQVGGSVTKEECKQQYEQMRKTAITTDLRPGGRVPLNPIGVALFLVNDRLGGVHIKKRASIDLDQAMATNWCESYPKGSQLIDIIGLLGYESIPDAFEVAWDNLTYYNESTSLSGTPIRPK